MKIKLTSFASHVSHFREVFVEIFMSRAERFIHSLRFCFKRSLNCFIQDFDTIRLTLFMKSTTRRLN